MTPISRKISTALAAAVAILPALPAWAQQAAPAGGAAVAAMAQAEGTATDAQAPATAVPQVLAPVDQWREDPKVILEATEIDLADFQWIARPVVVFADTPADPAFRRQLDLLAARSGELVERDVVVITDTDAAALSPLRRKLRPRGFMLAILGKDGGVKLRKPFPWDVREISRSIDKMPLRKQEIRDRRNANQ